MNLLKSLNHKIQIAGLGTTAAKTQKKQALKSRRLLDQLDHKKRTAQSLSASDWLILIEAWGWLLFFHAALFATSYARLDDSARAVDSSARAESRASADARITHLHQLIRYAAQLHFIPITCLERSLTLQKMLTRENIPAQIKIGANKIEGLLYAHAWVEVNGKAPGEADDVAKKFNVLTAFKINKVPFI